MRITLGVAPFLPDLTEEQIRRQVDYCLAQGWTLALRVADEMPASHQGWRAFGAPLFEARDPAAVIGAIRACRAAHPAAYIRVDALDPVGDDDAARLSFIIGRPRPEPMVRFDRPEAQARLLRHRQRVPGFARA